MTCVFHVYHFPSNLSKGKEMKKAIHIHTDDAIYVYNQNPVSSSI